MRLEHAGDGEPGQVWAREQEEPGKRSARLEPARDQIVQGACPGITAERDRLRGAVPVPDSSIYLNDLKERVLGSFRHLRVGGRPGAL